MKIRLSLFAWMWLGMLSTLSYGMVAAMCMSASLIRPAGALGIAMFSIAALWIAGSAAFAAWFGRIADTYDLATRARMRASAKITTAWANPIGSMVLLYAMVAYIWKDVCRRT